MCKQHRIDLAKSCVNTVWWKQLRIGWAVMCKHWWKQHRIDLAKSCVNTVWWKQHMIGWAICINTGGSSIG